MNKKFFMSNLIWLVIAFVAFLLSLFRFDNPVAIASWIAPVFFMRFIRNNKWSIAVILGFIALQIATIIGYVVPLLPMIEESTSIVMDSSTSLMLLLKRGVLLSPLSVLFPFLLDKALYERLSKFTASLIYPSAVVAIESLLVVINTFGDTQFTLNPIVMISSIFGLYGISFLVTWFAPMINLLWEKDWNIKSLGKTGLVYGTIMGLLLIYGSTSIIFSKQVNKSVIPIAGITATNHHFMDFEEEIHFNELTKLPSDAFSELMSSEKSDLDEVYQKTIDAINSGAKIIVWQEMALRMESSVADVYLEELQQLADEKNVYLLVSYFRLLAEQERNNNLMKNMSVLFTPDGEIGWEYEKHILAAGVEDYMVTPGPKDIPYIDTPYGRIAQVICADLSEPEYIRLAAKNQIDLLFVPALDAQQYTPLFTLSGAYRAVENGITVVRITGTGYSCVIDPFYRNWAGQNSFIQGNANFYCNVPVITRKTLYNSVGFIFPTVIAVLLILLIAQTIIQGLRKKKQSV